jgi:hypothetical protein
MEFTIPLSDHTILHGLVNNIVLQIFSVLGKLKSHILFGELCLLNSKTSLLLKVLETEILPEINYEFPERN